AFELPPRRSALIGREHDIARVSALLAASDCDPPTRLVTLTGIGGVGKTRLARAVPHEGRSRFAHPGLLNGLAQVAEPSQVPSVLRHALGLADLGDAEAIDAVAAFLRGRHALVVLDNCEHLIDACARVVDTLLDSCPSISVLATSREPL